MPWRSIDETGEPTCSEAIYSLRPARMIGTPERRLEQMRLAISDQQRHLEGLIGAKSDRHRTNQGRQHLSSGRLEKTASVHIFHACRHETSRAPARIRNTKAGNANEFVNACCCDLLRVQMQNEKCKCKCKCKCKRKRRSFFFLRTIF